MKFGNLFQATGTVTIDANPATYVAGGIALNLAQDLVKAQRPPVYWDFQSQAGFSYAYVPGADVTSGKLKIFTGDGTELGNGANIPAGNSGDVIQAQFQWIGMN
jgi:hypothetical protein